MHLFITGISGFVGGRLAGWLAERGERASGIYVAGRPAPPSADCWEVDLLDRPALAAAIGRAAPDAVLHLGALSHVGSSWERMGDYFRVNVLGTENLLEAAAAAHGAPRVVFASSAEVYGAVGEDELPIAETRLPAPASPYALTKAAAERLALARGGVVVRSFNLVGAGQAASFALPSFARQLAAIERGDSEPVLRVGNLSARRDFVHVADALAAYRLLAEKGEPGEVYNLASGEAVSIRGALDRLMAISGVEAEIEVDEARLRPVDVPVLAGDSTRLRSLGWQPEHDLDDALAELWREARDEKAA
ncbi:MAG TPA: GDP-mannose 4,6-dehydratase [Thermoanaerobaculia bacterium]|nr:GDP-mannose 4,6-dehydratase [Thermoanaerobaculia bacterium]